MEQRRGQREKKDERAGCGEDSASSHRRAGERERVRRGREGGGKKRKERNTRQPSEEPASVEGGAGDARLYIEGRGLVTSQPAGQPRKPDGAGPRRGEEGSGRKRERAGVGRA
ncbi:unnamed protein product [Rangifer tarandus platyrhynchus]|uniref:Uncharacterized protein n=2 Tax=Rangifer tarandus platyrhynchus TaxID=3082113 RepID=A0ACB0DXQ5_RANTA|nr:unnamed protein product [Rangifer tarandus platyrhynchus]CAI9693035.1 unnamed protein product [Rangifer tarandus platyrhynchus]